MKLNPDSEWELYHLAEDRTETNNLADRFPEKLEELVREWEQRAEALQVYPLPN